MPGKRSASMVLPVPGWTDHQQVMSARRGDLQGTTGLVLSAHVAHVGPAGGQVVEIDRCGRRTEDGVAAEPGAHLGQAVGKEHVGFADEGRFRRIGAGNDDAPAGATRANQRGKDAGDGAQLARQGQLAKELAVVETLARNLRTGGEDPRAMARSNRPPSFGNSAGARFTVTRRLGYSKAVFWMATRTRSRASRTDESGSPTIEVEGSPPDRCTSTTTCGAVTPSCARERVTARLMMGDIVTGNGSRSVANYRDPVGIGLAYALLASTGKITAPDRSRGEGDGSGAVPGRLAVLIGQEPQR
jgi:hypothetical protein